MRRVLHSLPSDQVDSLLLWLKTPLPPRGVLSLTLLFLLGGALLGYLASLPYLQYWLSAFPYGTQGEEGPVDLEGVLGEWWGILKGNALILLLIALLWLWYPRASQYALFLLAFRTGLLASPYDQIVINVLPYTAILLLVGPLEFAAYAQAASGRFALGGGLLLVSSGVEVLLIHLLL